MIVINAVALKVVTMGDINVKIILVDDVWHRYKVEVSGRGSAIIFYDNPYQCMRMLTINSSGHSLSYSDDNTSIHPYVSLRYSDIN